MTNRSIVGGKTIRSLTAQPDSNCLSRSFPYTLSLFLFGFLHMCIYVSRALACLLDEGRERERERVGSSALEFISRSEELADVFLGDL